MSVVIPTYGRPRYLDRQLASLARQKTAVPFEVIVADNGCARGALALAGFRGRLDLRVVDATAQRGRCYARNHGARSARSPAILFLDDDDETAPGYVDAMARALRRHAVVGARVDLRALNPRWLYTQTWASPIGVPEPGRPPCIMSSALGIRRGAFEEVGGFDESFHEDFEDCDLCWRLDRLGYDIAFVPDAVLHYRLRAPGRALASKARRMTVGAAQFSRKHAGAALPEPTTFRAGVRYLCGSVLRAAAGGTPQVRAEGWCGLGICLGHAELAVRRPSRPALTTHGTGANVAQRMTLPTAVSAGAGRTSTASGATAPADGPEPITLVVPVRDEEATLPALLRSIEAQTRAPDHVVFVDAGSRDASHRIVAEACGRHADWRVVAAGPATPGRARNEGIARAPTDLIALADAGTVIDAHWLDRLARRASPDVDLVWGHVEPSVTDAYAAAAALVFLAPPDRASDGPMRAGHVHSSLIRKALWARVGGFPDLRAAEDRIFVRRIEELGPTVARAPEAVVHWSMPDGFAATFARFRLYSRVNVDAGQQGDWHHGVARLYLVSLPFWLLATAGRRAWAMVPLAGFAARIGHSIWQRRAGRGAAWAANPARLLRVAAITLTVDAATFAGWIDAAAARRRRR